MSRLHFLLLGCSHSDSSVLISVISSYLKCLFPWVRLLFECCVELGINDKIQNIINMYILHDQFSLWYMSAFIWKIVYYMATSWSRCCHPVGIEAGKRSYLVLNITPQNVCCHNACYWPCAYLPLKTKRVGAIFGLWTKSYPLSCTGASEAELRWGVPAPPQGSPPSSTTTTCGQPESHQLYLSASEGAACQ